MEARRLLCRLSLAAVTLCVVAVLPAAGENDGSGTVEDPYRVPRTESGVRIDADLEEPAWRDALRLAPVVDRLNEVLATIPTDF